MPSARPAVFSCASQPISEWMQDLARRNLVWAIVSWSFVSLLVSVLYILLHPDGIDKINSGETTLLWKNILSFNPVVRLPEFLVGVFAGRLSTQTPFHHLSGSHPLALPIHRAE
jgi:hypothetical protein